MTGLVTGTSRRPAAGLVVLLSLTMLAFASYTSGFRAAGFSWTDAAGAAFAHVVPGATVAVGAWRLQPRMAAGLSPAGIALHLLSAGGTALAWLLLTLLVTLIARPDILVDVIPRAAPGTLFSGLAVYGSIAIAHRMMESRRRAALREAALARAELAALRAKVEPHFLYNTLETISGLLRARPDAAEEAIARLGRMLRRVLDAPLSTEADDLVPLSRELQLVRDYLAIETLRMGERLRVVAAIDDTVLGLGVPPFVLQTLVENAVQHGLAPRTEGGTLAISAAREGGDLVLVVSDDGKGTDEARLEAGGLGLNLLRSRLDAHFPDHAKVDFAATPERGTSVRVAIPVREVE
jgi:hypothetical protein